MMGDGMARPAKVRERVFCKGMLLPMTYRLPDEVLDWLKDTLGVHERTGYCTMVCNPVDVVDSWREVVWTVKGIQERCRVSYSYAARILQYVERLDKYIVRWYERAGEGLGVLDVSECIEWRPNRYGLRLDRDSGELWEKDEEAIEAYRISKEGLDDVMRRLGW